MQRMTMEDKSQRTEIRDRILNDLRSTIKQIYHESVNKELSGENKTYLCLNLIKNLDETLRHGLRQLHLGYWKALERLLHRQTRDLVEALPSHGAGNNKSEYSSLARGRAWISSALQDDSFSSYMMCYTRDTLVLKLYEPWSIIRNCDAVNTFLSILSGLESVSFTFQMEYYNKPPTYSDFAQKDTRFDKLELTLSRPSLDTSLSSMTSPVDSGCVMPDSDPETTDIDYLNGNVPDKVILRKANKNPQRHVSFHEDIISKSPDKCRKLRWDCESQRYSWSGEELDFPVEFVTSTPVKPEMGERGAPEGEESPPMELRNVQKSVIVRRFLQSIKKQSRIKQLSAKYRNNMASCRLPVEGGIERESIYRLNREIDEIVSRGKRGKRAKSYQLRDCTFKITRDGVSLLNANGVYSVDFEDITQIVIYPGAEVFTLFEGEKRMRLVGGSSTDDMMGMLDWCARKRDVSLDFRLLELEDLALSKRLGLAESDVMVYYGVARLEREETVDWSVPSLKKGGLMYRDVRFGLLWTPGIFQLKNGILYLYADDELPRLAVNLARNCRGVCRIKDPARPHAFQLTVTDGGQFEDRENCFYEDEGLKRGGEVGRYLEGVKARIGQWFQSSKDDDVSVIELAASDEEDLAAWMEAILQATCGDCGEDASKDATSEVSLLTTETSLLLFKESWTPLQQVERISTARIADIAAFRVGGASQDAFVYIEFSCMEADGSTGDWLLYFAQIAHLARFTAAIERQWRSKRPFPRETLRESTLVERCRTTQASHTIHQD